MQPKRDGVSYYNGFNPPHNNARYSAPSAYPMSYTEQPRNSPLVTVYPPGGYPKGDYPPGGYPPRDYSRWGQARAGYPQGQARAGYPGGQDRTGYPGGQDWTAYPGGQDWTGYPVGQDWTAYTWGLAADGESCSEDIPPDYEAEEENLFSDASIRRGFIWKVYLTLTIQLVVTTVIIVTFSYWEALRKWTLYHWWLSYCMITVMMVVLCVLLCCGNVLRRVPINYVALGLFTISLSLMMATLTVHFAGVTVLWAIGATALVSFSQTLFALQTKWDFTGTSGSVWVFVSTLLAYAFLSAIMRSQYLYIFYACLGTFFFSIYLVVDTQQIVGGKSRRVTVSPEDYVFAALLLYLDIMNLFLLLLQLMNWSN